MKLPSTRILGFIIAATAIGFVAAKYFATEDKSKTTRPAPLSDEDLRQVVATMRLQPREAASAISPREKKLIELGSKLFFDKGFSANQNVSCGTCHQPEKSFTDGKTTAEGLAKTAMNTPTLINSYAGQWFFWNGRADSLESQALGPVENAKEHGFSRTQVARRLASEYKSAYEDLFGPLPIELTKKITDAPAIPAARPPKISDEMAAYSLATLSSSDLQKSILARAQRENKQPVEILKVISSGPDEAPGLFETFTPAEQEDINLIFARFGAAIAAFERTITADHSPFDQFAAKLTDKPNPDDALVEGFGASELRGLRLFAGRGNCVLCHQGAHFSDQQFHNIGLMALTSETIDLGRAQGMLIARESPFNCAGTFYPRVTARKDPLSESCRELPYLETESTESVGAFKTPTLRNLRDTAPYGHDGRFPAVGDILRHYNHLSVPPAVGHIEESLRPLGFTSGELLDLEAFLMSLSGPVAFYDQTP